MSLFASMADDLTAEHTWFATALTGKTKGSVHYSCAFSYKVNQFLSLNYPKSLDENHSRYSTSLGLTGVPEAVPGGASLARLGISEHDLSAASCMENAWRDRGNARQRAAVCFVVLQEEKLMKLLQALRSCCNSHTSNDC